MAKIRIEHDGTPLNGTVRLDGGKHAFAHSLACAALCDQGRLTNVPDHMDARALRTALALVFEQVRYDRRARALSFATPVHRPRVTISSELTGQSRNLFCLLPALLSRAGEVTVEAVPQGCQIGHRPTEWYLKVLSQFGVRARAADTATVLSWPRRQAAQVAFIYPTMTGTVIAVAAAAVSPGRSSIRNASVEPSCAEQLSCLRAMEGRVSGELPAVEVDGASGYAEANWAIAPDRIHAVTYLTAGLLTRGEVTVTGSGPLRIPRFVDFLQRMGVRVTDRSHALTAGFPAEGVLRPVVVDAGSEPLFSSDWVTFAALLLATRSSGRSVISDDVFLQRFKYIDNLTAHGLDGVRLRVGERRNRAAVYADIRANSQDRLRGGDFGTCADIRGSAALLVAGLAADGPCTLQDDFHLRRGYGDLPGDLSALGVQRVGEAREEVTA